MLGYLVSSRVGAITYNLVHTTTGPLLILCAGVLLKSHVTAGLALIWLVHIGVDRALGYGLKYGTSFGDTHLGLLGEQRAKAGAPLFRA